MSNVWQWDNFITPEKRARLEQLLQDEFSYHQLLFLTYDHFWEVYQAALGDDHAALARRLVDYAAKHYNTDKNLNYLHSLLQKHCPRAYKKYYADFNWNELGEQYRSYLLSQFDTMRVFGKSHPVKLENIFSDIYLIKELTIDHELDLFQTRAKKPNESQRHNGLEFVKRSLNPRLFILGKPGAGKTTFTRYLTYQTAIGELPKIPIYVKLRKFATAKISLKEFIVKQVGQANFEHLKLNLTDLVELVLKSGQALVLFDGLDEVKQEQDQREQLVREIEQFAAQYRTCGCIITCRPGVSQDQRFKDYKFAYVEMAAFSPKQIEQFVQHWFMAEAAKARQFLDKLRWNWQFKEFATEPILLAVMCLIFKDDFPTQRSQLYQRGVNALLKDWDKERLIQRDRFYLAPAPCR